MPIYRPRMHATLTVPLMGTREQRINQEASTEAIDVQIHPKSVRLESNDHNHADAATVIADWTEIGVDPRTLDYSVIQIFIDNADDFGNWKTTDANCRFIGIVKEISAHRDSDNAAEVTLECLDYTSLFLMAKPFGSSGVPRYDQTLDDAWRTIVSQTPGAAILADALVLQGLVTFPVIGKAVSERFRKLGHVPTHPDTDAWAVWQECVGMLGLLSYIKADKVIITTATNYYTETDSPVLIYGKNVEEWNEVRHAQFANKGVGLTSFDPVTLTTIEAFWPEIGDSKIRHKRYTAKKKLSQEQILAREERDYFAIPGITDPEALLEKAKTVYEERSRQEIEGHVKTREMFVDTESGANFDLLNLAAGDSVKVMVDPKERQLLAALPSDDDRATFLQARGYSDGAAQLIIANTKEFGTLESKFLVKSVTTDFEVTEDGGSFAVEFEYINRIQIDGSAVA